MEVRTRARRGGDLDLRVNVSLLKKLRLASKKKFLSLKMLLKREQLLKLCTTCNGHGEVRRQQGFFTIAQPCHTCGGTGEIAERVKKKSTLSVKIPAGIDHGQTIKTQPRGRARHSWRSKRRSLCSNAFEEHDFFERDGFDVYCDVPISFSQAALGSESRSSNSWWKG